MPAPKFGTPESMISFFQWEAEQSVTNERSMSVRRTIGGGSFAFRSPRSRRSWKLKNEDVPLEETAAIESRLQDMESPGTGWFLDPWSQVTNALTPSQSKMSSLWVAGDYTPGAQCRLDSGIIVPGVSSSGGTVSLRARVPVAPAEQITASIHVTGSGAQASVRIYDYTGAQQSVAALRQTERAGNSFTRLWSSVVSPSRSCYAEIYVFGAAQICAPAITFTPDLTAWHPGHGCDSAVLGPWDVSYGKASALDPSRRGVSMSLEVEEVGSLA